MGRVRWQERIVIAKDLHHGTPCIKGTRIPVATIVASLADGMTADEIQEEYPQLSSLDIRAALAYTADVLHWDFLVPVPVQEQDRGLDTDLDPEQGPLLELVGKVSRGTLAQGTDEELYGG